MKFHIVLISLDGRLVWQIWNCKKQYIISFDDEDEALEYCNKLNKKCLESTKKCSMSLSTSSLGIREPLIKE